jgi:hypothetical protein
MKGSNHEARTTIVERFVLCYPRLCSRYGGTVLGTRRQRARQGGSTRRQETQEGQENEGSESGAYINLFWHLRCSDLWRRSGLRLSQTKDGMYHPMPVKSDINKPPSGGFFNGHHGRV